MAVKIRLTRRGRKDAPVYNIVATDSRVARDGKFIKKLGLYNPCTNPSTVEINREDTLLYLLNGAQTTFTVRRLLSDAGIMIKKHLQVGVIKGKISQQEADKKFDEWRKDKERIIGKPLPGFAVTKAEDKKNDVKEAKASSAKPSVNKETKIESNAAKVEKIEKVKKTVKTGALESAKGEEKKVETAKNIKEEKVVKTGITKSTKEEKPVAQNIKTAKSDMFSEKKENIDESKAEKKEVAKEAENKNPELKKENKKVEVKEEVAKKNKVKAEPTSKLKKVAVATKEKEPSSKNASEDKEKPSVAKSSTTKKNEK